MKMNRRDFVKYSIGAGATVLVGGGVISLLNANKALAFTGQTLDITITDALKDMVTHNTGKLPNGTTVGPGNPAQCYFWIYKVTADGTDIPAEVPGPNIIAVEGDTITLNITNRLDESHSFDIPGAGVIVNGLPLKDAATVAPGETRSVTFTVPPAGPYLYYDSLNAPVNRVMGLHGAFISMQAAPASGHKYTPYASPTPAVQQLYDDFGGGAHWPGLAWEQGADNPPDLDGKPVYHTMPFRQYVWLLHQPSPNLFAEVGNYTPGQDYPAADFVQKFLRSPFVAEQWNNSTSYTPQYFTISGQSGATSHYNPYICPTGRSGEPCVIHVMNAGLMGHSMHIHANHVFITYRSAAENLNDGISANGAQENPIWVDVYTLNPLDMVDYTLPFMRPPDVPNKRGIGNIDILSGNDGPLMSIANPLLTGSVPHPVWPPTEEMGVAVPFSIPSKIGVNLPGVSGLTAKDQNGNTIDLGVQLSPLCYPMHDHSEPSQTSQGGNYNMGMISGMDYTGDRNIRDANGNIAVTTFPNSPPDLYAYGPNKTWLARGRPT